MKRRKRKVKTKLKFIPLLLLVVLFFPRCSFRIMSGFAMDYPISRQLLRKYIVSAMGEVPHSPFINKTFLEKLVETESSRNLWACGGDWWKIWKEYGLGLAQVTPSAWRQVIREKGYHFNVFDPKENIKASIKYLKWINEYCKITHPNWKKLSSRRRQALRLAAYNGGVKRLHRAGWNINCVPRETREYVRRNSSGK